MIDNNQKDLVEVKTEDKEKECRFEFIDSEPFKKQKYENDYVFKNKLDEVVFFSLPLTFEQRKELYNMQ